MPRLDGKPTTCLAVGTARRSQVGATRAGPSDDRREGNCAVAGGWQEVVRQSVNSGGAAQRTTVSVFLSQWRIATEVSDGLLGAAN